MPLYALVHALRAAAGEASTLPDGIRELGDVRRCGAGVWLVASESSPAQLAARLASRLVGEEQLLVLPVLAAGATLGPVPPAFRDWLQAHA